jgi:hypothetical protein
MKNDEYNYWLQTRSSYERNLKNNIGHAESIRAIIDKIDKKIKKG